MKRLVLLAAPIAAMATLAFAQDAATPDAPVPTLPVEQGLEAWTKIHEVVSHPRCANCHVGDDGIPMWSGPSYGKTQPHGMNIKAGESRIGAEALICSTCHSEHNAEAPHGPPGAEIWALPPVEMQWWEKSSAEICAQLQDPERNGGRTLEEIRTHVADDALVGWGWAPGPGREPAPYSAEETAGFIDEWAAAGAPCPTQ